MFAVAGLAALAGFLEVVGWGVALVFATVAVLLGDAAWHLSRKAHARAARKAQLPVTPVDAQPSYERFSDYPVEQENAA